MREVPAFDGDIVAAAAIGDIQERAKQIARTQHGKPGEEDRMRRHLPKHADEYQRHADATQNAGPRLSVDDVQLRRV